jgi:uroporphyrin-3 C-methyltransferase
MTEQQNQSAVVEETRRPWKPHHSQRRTRKEEGGSKTSLALSAIAIAIAIAAGVGLYGLNKQQATRQNETTSELSSQIAALQKAQESQKANWKALSNSRPTS